MRKELKDNDYDTDKRVHPHYLQNFQEHFGHLAEQPITLLELGVYHGGSLLMWRDYFVAGKIVGIDINPVSLADETGRINFYQGRQQDTKFLDEVASSAAPEGFDVIIDDASHIGELTRKSFWHLFDHHLKPGGIYVIEDWGTGYWSSWFDGEDYIDRAEKNNLPVSSMIEWCTNKLRMRNSQLDPAEKNSESKPPLSSIIEWYAKKLGMRNFQVPAILKGKRFRKRFPSHDFGMVGFIKELVDECGMGDITHPERTKRPYRASKFKRMIISHGHVFIYKQS